MPGRVERTPNTEIRPFVWITGGVLALIAVALVTVATFDPSAAARSALESERAARTAAPESTPAGQAPADPHPEVPRRTEPAPAAPGLHRTPAPSDASSVEPLRRSQSDSRFAADLRILEAEAARRAESLDLAAARIGDGTPIEPRGPADDARRAAFADALLIAAIEQDVYRGTLFPIGFPAETRTRADATSRVGAMDPAMRLALLESVLAQPVSAPVAPRFETPESGLVWEGAPY